MSSEILAVLSMAGTLLLIIAIFVGAYFVSKAVGKKYQGLGPSMKEGMELLDRRPVGKEENLLVVRVGGRVFLLGATPYHIGMIEELDATLFPEKAPMAPSGSVSFGAVWKEVLNRTKKSEEGEHKND